jgi:hypothetical protein
MLFVDEPVKRKRFVQSLSDLRDPDGWGCSNGGNEN